MNNREAIEKSKAHMLQQERVAGDGDSCQYWDEYGNTCGVGCLLKPETAQNLEKFCPGKWKRVANNAPVNKAAGAAVKELEDVSFELLCDLQRIHDATRGASGVVSNNDTFEYSRTEASKRVIAEECDVLLRLYT